MLISAGLVVSFTIVWRQYLIFKSRIIGWYPVYILSIDETTTHLVSLHIDQVEFHHTGDIAIVLMVSRTLLGGHLQEHT